MLWKCSPIEYVDVGRFPPAVVQCHLSLQLTLAAIFLLTVKWEERGDNCASQPNMRDNYASQPVIMLNICCSGAWKWSLYWKHAVAPVRRRGTGFLFSTSVGIFVVSYPFLSGKIFHCLFLCGWSTILVLGLLTWKYSWLPPFLPQRIQKYILAYKSI